MSALILITAIVFIIIKIDPYLKKLDKARNSPRKPIKQAGSNPKPILKPKEDPPNVIDFMFKPKSAGKPSSPRIRWRR